MVFKKPTVDHPLNLKESSHLFLDWLREREGVDVYKLERTAETGEWKQLKCLRSQFLDELKGLGILEEKKASWDDYREAVDSHFTAQRLFETREQLGLKKWIPLNQFVAFLATAKAVGAKEIKGRYQELCKYMHSNEDIRRLMRFEYQVKPVNLEHDIQSQSSEVNRSLVENISNAIDAMKGNEGAVDVQIQDQGYDITDAGTGMPPDIILERLLIPRLSGTSGTETIGRFGVGFYTTLSHLKTEQDQVSVMTSDGQQGFEITFRIHEKSGDIFAHINENADLPKGTSIRVQAEDFDSEDAQKICQNYLQYHPSRDIHINGSRLNQLKDYMRLSGVHTDMLYQPEVSDSCEVVVIIHGIAIEHQTIKGLNLPKQLVLNLPLDCALPESRNEVAVDQVACQAARELMQTALQSEDRIMLCNALYPVIELLQDRNHSQLSKENLLSAFQKQAKEAFSHDDQERFLPNQKGFEQLSGAEYVLINPGLVDCKIDGKEGVSKCHEFTAGTHQLYLAEFREGVDDICIEYGSLLILDRKVYEQHKDDPVLLNVYFSGLGHPLQGATQKSSNQPRGRFVSQKAPPIPDKETTDIPLAGALSISVINRARENMKNLYVEKTRDMSRYNEYGHEFFHFLRYRWELGEHWKEDLHKLVVLRAGKNPDCKAFAENLIDYLFGDVNEVSFPLSLEIPSPLQVQIKSFLKSTRESYDNGLSKEKFAQLVDDDEDDLISKFKSMSRIFWDYTTHTIMSLKRLKSVPEHLITYVRSFALDKEIKPSAEDIESFIRYCRDEWGLMKSFLDTILFPHVDHPLVSTHILYEGLKFVLPYPFEPDDYVARHNFDERESREDQRERYEKLMLEKSRKRRELMENLEMFAENMNAFYNCAGIQKLAEKVSIASPAYYFPIHCGSAFEKLAPWEHSFEEGHIEAINDFLSDEAHYRGKLAGQDPGEIRSFIKRLWEMRTLPSKHFKKMIPIFALSENEFDTDFFDISSIVEILEALSEFNDETLVLFFDMAQDIQWLSDRELYLSRFIELYKKKLALLPLENQKDVCAMFTQQSRVSLLGNKLIRALDKTGNADFRLENIPRQVRGYFLYLSEGGQLLESETSDASRLELKSYQGRFYLSELAQSKKLKEKQMSDYQGDPQALQSFVEETCARTDREVVVRDIAHAINHQIVNDGNLWVRELIQNGLDAVERAEIDQSKRQINIHAYRRETAFSVTRSDVMACLDECISKMYRGHKYFLQLVDSGIKDDDDLIPDKIREILMNCNDSENKPYFDKFGLKTIESVLTNLFAPEEELVMAVNDPVGMSLQEVINYLFVPGESIKVDEERQIGQFGQGFMTIFRNAKQVLIKTSDGKGMVTYLRATPITNREGKIYDVELEMSQTQEDFQGTAIQKVIDTDAPELDAALSKNAVICYSGVVDANKVRINYGDKQINSPRQVLVEQDVPPLGTVRIFDAKENVVSQNGLFVKTLDEEYLKSLPYQIKEVLMKEGIVIDLPTGVKLIRSRNDIARKQEVLPKLQAALPGLLIQAYLQKVRAGRIDLENLPYDYFDMAGFGSLRKYSFSQDIQADANRLNHQQALEEGRLRYYQEHPDQLMKLLTLVGCIDVKGERKSLYEIAQLIEQGAQIDTKDFPKALQDRINRSQAIQQQDRHFERQLEQQQEAAGVLFDTSLRPDHLRNPRLGILLAFDALRRQVEEGMGASDADRMYYHKPESSLAHASRSSNSIGWNLFHLESRLQLLSKILKGEASQKEVADFFEDLVQTESHEHQHLQEGSDDWTHNETFYEGQRKILASMIKSMSWNSEQILASIKEQLPEETAEASSIQDLVNLLK